MPADSQTASSSEWKSIDKRHFVMANALELLTEVGYQGLTMRGLADRCGMSLSNVQYYFRSKEELVDDIADRYFGDCNAILLAHFEEYGPIADRAGLERLVTVILEHGRVMTDMCRVFRELWAISSRHDGLSDLLNRHYRRLADTLGQNMKLPSMTEENRKRLITLFLAVSEGYSIVGSAQMMDHEDAISFFTDVLMSTSGGLENG